MDFYEILKDMSFVPAGRVLFGAGSGAEVTFFNCFVMPMIQDSRCGISEHRKEVMEIMSRGGRGVREHVRRERHELEKDTK